MTIIHYIERGAGEPLLLIHGLGNTIDLWNSQHALSEHFRLIIPELRGHGTSAITNDISIHTFVSDIFALLDLLKIEKVNICGLSLGGIIAQEMYVRRPSSCVTRSPTHLIFFEALSFFLGSRVCCIKQKQKMHDFLHPNVFIINRIGD